MADEIITTVRENWKKLAAGYGISRRQIEDMRPRSGCAMSDAKSYPNGKPRGRYGAGVGWRFSVYIVAIKGG